MEELSRNGQYSEPSSTDSIRTSVIEIMEKIQDEKQLRRIYGLTEYLYLYEETKRDNDDLRAARSFADAFPDKSKTAVPDALYQ